MLYIMLLAARLARQLHIPGLFTTALYIYRQTLSSTCMYIYVCVLYFKINILKIIVVLVFLVVIMCTHGDNVMECHVGWIPFQLSFPDMTSHAATKTVKSDHFMVIYPLYCMVYYSYQRSSHLWINVKRRLQSILSRDGNVRSVMALLSISDISCSNYGLGL